MKHIYFLPLFAFFSISIQSQIVNIPDENFKNALSGVDTNNDGEIQVSEAEAIQILRVNSEGISNLTGIEAFTNLKHLECRFNQISEVNLNNNTLLEILYIDNNSLTNIDLSNNVLLEVFYCEANQLTSLDLSNNIALTTLRAPLNQLSSININNLAVLDEFDIRYNQITNVDFSTNPLLDRILCSENQISSIDLSNNSNLTFLHLNDNLLSNLDLSGNSALSTVSCTNNEITNINLNSCPDLRYLYCSNNLISDIDLSSCEILQSIHLSNNLISSLDLSNQSDLGGYINISNNPNLLYLNYKNGNNIYSDISNRWNYDDLPNLEIICVDDANSDFATFWGNNFDHEVFFTDYCSFTPGGFYYTITGSTNINIDNNDCADNNYVFPNLTLSISNETQSEIYISNLEGNYTIPFQDGNSTLEASIENSDYFSINPQSVIINPPSDGNILFQNFCLTPNDDFNDLEISIVPLVVARPGFEAEYKIIYKNKGTTTLTGSVDFNYDDDYMDLLNTSPTADTQTIGNLSWEYSDLLPFETREILVTMSLNTPTDSEFPLNGDDVLEFDATINPSGIDETPEDNNMILNQVVVNSYDPNDKTCLQGAVVTPEQVGKYVHYVIRFENTGTANAVNVVVKDVIDTSKYDLNSLIPLDASHDFYTKIRNENEVEFIFENIQLPYDDANNDGYVVFKIKTLPSLVVGDTFSNEAQIYFDFNYPIITNTETTIVQENLSVDEYNLINLINVYPNPTNDYFKIHIPNNQYIKSIEILDLSGKVIKQFNTSETYNIEEIASGIYFLKVKMNDSETIKKLVKI